MNRFLQRLYPETEKEIEHQLQETECNLQEPTKELEGQLQEGGSKASSNSEAWSNQIACFWDGLFESMEESNEVVQDKDNTRENAKKKFDFVSEKDRDTDLKTLSDASEEKEHRSFNSVRSDEECYNDESNRGDYESPKFENEQKHLCSKSCDEECCKSAMSDDDKEISEFEFVCMSSFKTEYETESATNEMEQKETADFKQENKEVPTSPMRKLLCKAIDRDSDSDSEEIVQQVKGEHFMASEREEKEFIESEPSELSNEYPSESFFNYFLPKDNELKKGNTAASKEHLEFKELETSKYLYNWWSPNTFDTNANKDSNQTRNTMAVEQSFKQSEAEKEGPSAAKDKSSKNHFYLSNPEKKAKGKQESPSRRNSSSLVAASSLDLKAPTLNSRKEDCFERVLRWIADRGAATRDFIFGNLQETNTREEDDLAEFFGTRNWRTYFRNLQTNIVRNRTELV